MWTDPALYPCPYEHRNEKRKISIKPSTETLVDYASDGIPNSTRISQLERFYQRLFKDKKCVKLNFFFIKAGV